MNKGYLRTFATHGTGKAISSTLDSSLRPRIHLSYMPPVLKFYQLTYTPFPNHVSKLRVPVRNFHKLYR